MPKADIGVTSLARASNAGGTVMLFFRHRSAEMDSLLHWIGVAVVLLIIAFGLVGFWRYLSSQLIRLVVLPKGFGVGRLGNGSSQLISIKGGPFERSWPTSQMG